MSYYKDGKEEVIKEGIQAPKDAPVLRVQGSLVSKFLKQGSCLPQWWPYVRSCKKERSESCLYDNELYVVVDARTCLKDVSHDVHKQRKKFMPDDVANMVVGVPHTVN